MIADTSMQAYEAVKHKFSDRQRAVFGIIKRRGIASGEEVAIEMGLQMHEVSGRFTELLKFGVIGVEGHGKNSKGNSVRLYSIRDANDKTITDMAHDCEV